MPSFELLSAIYIVPYYSMMHDTVGYAARAYYISGSYKKENADVVSVTLHYDKQSCLGAGGFESQDCLNHDEALTSMKTYLEEEYPLLYKDTLPVKEIDPASITGTLLKYEDIVERLEQEHFL